MVFDKEERKRTDTVIHKVDRSDSYLDTVMYKVNVDSNLDSSSKVIEKARHDSYLESQATVMDKVSDTGTELDMVVKDSNN